MDTHRFLVEIAVTIDPPGMFPMPSGGKGREKDNASEQLRQLLAAPVGSSTLLDAKSLNTAGSLANKIMGPGNYVCKTEPTGVRVWRKQ